MSINNNVGLISVPLEEINMGTILSTCEIEKSSCEQKEKIIIKTEKALSNATISLLETSLKHVDINIEIFKMLFYSKMPYFTPISLCDAKREAKWYNSYSKCYEEVEKIKSELTQAIENLDFINMKKRKYPSWTPETNYSKDELISPIYSDFDFEANVISGSGTSSIFCNEPDWDHLVLNNPTKNVKDNLVHWKKQNITCQYFNLQNEILEKYNNKFEVTLNNEYIGGLSCNKNNTKWNPCESINFIKKIYSFENVLQLLSCNYKGLTWDELINNITKYKKKIISNTQNINGRTRIKINDVNTELSLQVNTIIIINGVFAKIQSITNNSGILTLCLNKDIGFYYSGTEVIITTMKGSVNLSINIVLNSNSYFTCKTDEGNSITYKVPNICLSVPFKVSIEDYSEICKGSGSGFCPEGSGSGSGSGPGKGSGSGSGPEGSGSGPGKGSGSGPGKGSGSGSGPGKGSGSGPGKGSGSGSGTKGSGSGPGKGSGSGSGTKGSGSGSGPGKGSGSGSGTKGSGSGSGPGKGSGSGSGTKGSGSGSGPGKGSGSGSGTKGSGSGSGPGKGSGSGSGTKGSGSGSGPEGSGSGPGKGSGSGSGPKGSGSGSGTLDKLCGSGILSIPTKTQIGNDSGATFFNHVPFTANKDYSWSTIMYNSDDLTSLNTGLITSLKFIVSNNGTSWNMKNQIIYMALVKDTLENFGNSNDISSLKYATFYLNPQSLQRILTSNIFSPIDYNYAKQKYDNGSWEDITADGSGESTWQKVFSGDIFVSNIDNELEINFDNFFRYKSGHGIIIKFLNNQRNNGISSVPYDNQITFKGNQKSNFYNFYDFKNSSYFTTIFSSDGTPLWSVNGQGVKEDWQPIITFKTINQSIDNGLFSRIDLDEAEALGTFRAGETITYSVTAIDQSGISQIKSTLVVGSGNDSNVGELGSKWNEGSGDEQQEGSGISFNPSVTNVFETKTFTLPSNSANKQFYIETEITYNNNKVCKIYSDIEKIRDTSQYLTATAGSGTIQAGTDVGFEYLFEVDSGTLNGVEIAIVTGSGSGEVVVATESLAGASGSGTITIPDIVSGETDKDKIIDKEIMHYKTFTLRLTPQGINISPAESIYANSKLGPILPGSGYIAKRTADFELSEDASKFQMMKRMIKLLRVYDYYVKTPFPGSGSGTALSLRDVYPSTSSYNYFDKLQLGKNTLPFSKKSTGTSAYSQEGPYYYNAPGHPNGESYQYKNIAFFGRGSDSSSPSTDINKGKIIDVGIQRFEASNTLLGRNIGTKVYDHPEKTDRQRHALPEALRDDIKETFIANDISINEIESAKTMADLLFIEELWHYESGTDFQTITGLTLSGSGTLILVDDTTPALINSDWFTDNKDEAGFTKFIGVNDLNM